eukprot:14795029-Alexandrium_andersonii.AAC.1
MSSRVGRQWVFLLPVPFRVWGRASRCHDRTRREQGRGNQPSGAPGANFEVVSGAAQLKL